MRITTLIIDQPKFRRKRLRETNVNLFLLAGSLFPANLADYNGGVNYITRCLPAGRLKTTGLFSEKVKCKKLFSMKRENQLAEIPMGDYHSAVKIIYQLSPGTLTT